MRKVLGRINWLISSILFFIIICLGLGIIFSVSLQAVGTTGTKFQGIVLKDLSSTSEKRFSVDVQKHISGHEPCSDPIEVVLPLGIGCTGTVDNSVGVGDKVEVYGDLPFGGCYVGLCYGGHLKKIAQTDTCTIDILLDSGQTCFQPNKTFTVTVEFKKNGALTNPSTFQAKLFSGQISNPIKLEPVSTGRYQDQITMDDIGLWTVLVNCHIDGCQAEKTIDFYIAEDCSNLGQTEFLCTDGLDNDADGKTDCDDPDCAEHVCCSGEPIDVEFEGLVTSDKEVWSDTACYGHYTVKMRVTEIIQDGPLYVNCRKLQIGQIVQVDYDTENKLVKNDTVRIRGKYYWKMGPLQCLGDVVGQVISGNCAMEIDLDGEDCFDPGEIISQTIRFRDNKGHLADPDSGTFKVILYKPDNSSTDITSQFKRISTGIYQYNEYLLWDNSRFGTNKLVVTAKVSGCDLSEEISYEIKEDCNPPTCLVKIDTDGGKTCYEPGDNITVTVKFSDELGGVDPSHMEIRYCVQGYCIPQTKRFKKFLPGVYRLEETIPFNWSGFGKRSWRSWGKLPDGCEASNSTEYEVNCCDSDCDNDGIPDAKDNCPRRSNPKQYDIDSDGLGDICDQDDDNDGVDDAHDNCPQCSNLEQWMVMSDGCPFSNKHGYGFSNHVAGGKCFGMSMTAGKYYTGDMQIPGRTDKCLSCATSNMIAGNQMQHFANMTKEEKTIWQRIVDKQNSAKNWLETARCWLMTDFDNAIQISGIMESIDQGEPCLVTLGRSGLGRKDEHHTVIAYAYRYDGPTGKCDIALYDPNKVGGACTADQINLTLSNKDPVTETYLTASFKYKISGKDYDVLAFAPLSWQETLKEEIIDTVKTPFKYIATMAVNSAAELHLFDSQGRHTGPVSTGDFEQGIPNSAFELDSLSGSQTIVVVREQDEPFTFEVRGQEDGVFDLVLTRLFGQGQERKLFEEVSFSSSTQAKLAVGQGQDVQMKLDDNNDGVADRELRPDLVKSDRDGDGLTDDWEQKYGTQVDRPDSEEDPDKDQRTNFSEFSWKTDPLRPDLPNPDDGLIIDYSAAKEPLAIGVAQEAKPLGLGEVIEGGELIDFSVDLLPCAGSTDIYFLLYAPTLNPNEIYLLDSNNSFVAMSERLVAWRTGVSKRIQEKLFAPFSASLLPEGQYFFGLLVSPSEGLNQYYFWITSLSIPMIPVEPILYASTGELVDTGSNFAGGSSCCGCVLKHSGTIPGNFPESDIKAVTFYLKFSRQNSFYSNIQEGPTKLKLVLGGREAIATSEIAPEGLELPVKVPWLIKFQFSPAVRVGYGTKWEILDADDNIYSAVGLHASDSHFQALPGISKTNQCQYARTTDLWYSVQFDPKR